MKQHAIKSWGIIMGLILSFSTYAQETKWVFVKEKEGIKVFYRKSAFKELNEVMIQTTFNTKLSIIVAAFNDFDAYPNWVYKSVKSYLIKTINQNEIEYYNKFDFPFPLDDREIVIHNKIEQNPQNKVVTSISYASTTNVPLENNTVRIKEFNSKWTFIPQNGVIYGEYIFKSNPGGNIPIWLVNLTLDEAPIQTIKNFKKQLMLTKYKTANPFNIIN
jgi:hypothetical protein